MNEPLLVLAWLVLAHLAADFLLQTNGIVHAKNGHGPRAAVGLLAHAAIVAACLIPVGLAFGGPGWAFLAVSAVLHLLIDRSKIVATRRAAARALVAAHRQHEGRRGPDQLGRAWTPEPAALFLADQLAHLTVAAVAWAWLLSTAPLQAGWTEAINRVLGPSDRAAVHAVVAAAVVVAALVIVNVRAAALFVAILVRPVEQTEDETRWGGRAGPAVPSAVAADPEPGVAPVGVRRWSVRLGPLQASVAAEPQADAEADAEARAGAPSGAGHRALGSPPVPAVLHARVGATIGVLERILIVVFVLTGSEVAIGFVVAAKTLARFRQLDDREFAEYYLLGTLASVAVAIVTGLVGRAALRALIG